jgi:hypothetical protein
MLGRGSLMSEVSPDHGVGCCCMFPNVINPACKTLQKGGYGAWNCVVCLNSSHSPKVRFQSTKPQAKSISICRREIKNHQSPTRDGQFHPGVFSSRCILYYTEYECSRGAIDITRKRAKLLCRRQRSNDMPKGTRR